MSAPASNRLDLEETRIRAAYAKRPVDERYSSFNSAHLLSVQQRERVLLESLKRSGMTSLAGQSVLELGCGTGLWLRELIKWGVRPENLVGIDLVADRVAEARRLCPAGVHIDCGSATRVGYPSQSFDLVLQSMLFTSILESSVRQQVADEMVRVLKPGGRIIWYDYRVNSPRNRDVRGVRRREIRQLFTGYRITLSSVTLAAPLARLVAPRLPGFCLIAERLPWLCTHYLGVIQKVD